MLLCFLIAQAKKCPNNQRKIGQPDKTDPDWKGADEELRRVCEIGRRMQRHTDSYIENYKGHKCLMPASIKHHVLPAEDACQAGIQHGDREELIQRGRQDTLKQDLIANK